MKTRYLPVAAACLALVTSQSCLADDKTKLNVALFESLGTTAIALGQITASSVKKPATGNYYEDLALKVATKVDEGRAAGSLIRAQTDMTAAYLTYVAAVDPEPYSKTAAALAAFAFQKGGDVLSSAVQKQFVEDANAILATGLKNSVYSAAQMQAMSADEYSRAVGDFQVGDQKLREILPAESLNVLKNAAERLRENNQVATLVGVKKLQGDVASIKRTAGKTAKDFADFAKASEARMDKIETGLTALNAAAEKQKSALDNLQNAVKDNQAAVRSLAQVSSMSWSPEQKLAALDSGLISGLGKNEKAFRDALLAEVDTKQRMQMLQEVASDLGHVATIAQNLGLPPEIATVAQVGQTVAGALINFSAQNYLGGFAALSGLAGMGKSDPGAERHKALMEYLGREFAQVNQKLDNIIALQKTTLEALFEVDRKIDALAIQLNRVEGTVTLNRISLQQLLLNDWLPCDAVMGALDNRGRVSNLKELETIFNKPLNVKALKECETAYSYFFNGRVKNSQWGDGILGIVAFPHTRVFDGTSEAAASTAIAQQEQKRYEKARSFLLQYAASGSSGTTPRLLSKLLEPARQASFVATRDARVEKAKKLLDDFKCGQKNIIANAIATPLCQGVSEGDAPQKAILPRLLDASLAGPQALRMIDVGLPVAELLQFTYEDSASQLTKTVPWVEIRDASIKGLTPKMKLANKHGAGVDMHERLDWLSAGYLLQQSVMYGDTSAAAIVDVLWDPSTNTLRGVADPAKPLEAYALEAIGNNGPLARNVVTIALRKALTKASTLGEPTVAVPSYITYELGLRDIKGQAGCTGTGSSLSYLRQALPNWKFELRKLPDLPGQPPQNPELSACAAADGDTDVGDGIGVMIGNLFVKAPSPEAIKLGRLEWPSSLDLAWHYRTRIAEAKTLSRIAELLPKTTNANAANFVNELMQSTCFSDACR